MYLLNSKKLTQLVLATLFVAIASFSVSAQKKKTAAHSEPKKPVIISEAGSNNESGKSTASAKSSNIFVQSLRDQLVIREREIAVAKEALEKTKQLFADGIVSKRAVEEAEVTLIEAQTKADDVRRKLSVYEGNSTETTAENKIEEEAKKDDVVMATTENVEKKSTVKRTSQTKAKKTVKKGKSKN